MGHEVTAAFDDHFDGTSDRLSAKLSTRLAHSIIWLLPITMVTSIAFWLGPDWTWLRISNNTAWIFMMFAYLSAILHQDAPRLCVKCMQEVPIDAAQKAQGLQRFFLLLMHLSRKTAFTLLVALLVFIHVPPFLWDENNYVQILIIVIPNLYISCLIYGMWLHHRLRPWCPYCRRWGDGGEAELIPDPDPSESRKV